MILPAAAQLIAFARAQLEERRSDIAHPLPRTAAWPDVRPGDAPDLITACLTLSPPDLQAKLAAIHHILAPGGLFLGALWGGQSLAALREALIAAESEDTGGAALRIAPLPQADELARQMVAAGFALPVVDVERVATAMDLPTLHRAIKQFRAARPEQTRPLSARIGRRVQRALPDRIEGEILFVHGWKIRE